MIQSTNRKQNLRMRACPRCGGDLYRDLMENDVEYVCLQCGRRAAQRIPPRPITEEDWREVA